MKLLQNTILVFTFFYTTIIYAQTPPAVQQDLMNFEPGELIVKLKDNVEAGVTYAENGKAISSFNIGELLNIEDKVASSEVMFHQKSIEASIANSQRLKALYAAKAAANPNNGYSPKEPLTMKNVFVVKTTDEQENILQLIQQIKDDPNVEYAEPNYIYGIDDFEVGEMITAEEVSKMSTTNSMLPIEVNDPLYSSQTNITSTNIDDVWDQYTTGDGSQVIAILDTGGDYTHPDLEANTWINTEELNGVEGYDDDGNGYVDDIHGWNFIGGKNGENVDKDTYEVTRVYNSLRYKYENVDSSKLNKKQLKEYKFFQEVKEEVVGNAEKAEKNFERIKVQRDNLLTSVIKMAEAMGDKEITSEISIFIVSKE